MKLGEIYYWETDQAQGHSRRNKYHVYICEADWRTQGHSFLFISKSDYGGDYPIKKGDYPFMPLDRSYICCRGIVTYTNDEVTRAKPSLKGLMSLKHLSELHDAVATSEIMEQWQIRLVCDAIRRFLAK